MITYLPLYIQKDKNGVMHYYPRLSRGKAYILSPINYLKVRRTFRSISIGLILSLLIVPILTTLFSDIAPYWGIFAFLIIGGIAEYFYVNKLCEDLPESDRPYKKKSLKKRFFSLDRPQQIMLVLSLVFLFIMIKLMMTLAIVF